MLFSLLLLLVLVFAWPKLLLWLNQPIKRVEVHAPFRFLHKDRVESVLKPFLRQHFFQLDLKGLQEALLEEAWVKEVSFSKDWPDRLTVSLEEKEPVARWYERQLITGDGDIFSPSDVGHFSELPVLKGPQSQAQAVMLQYLAISQLLRPLGLSVSELELGRTGAWQFNIGDIQVYLGRDERMERLQRFVRLYHARLESEWHSVKRIDLRYSNGAAVAWRGSK
ncbi:cell division protein FtsQ/DivIB [Endozoicomonas sp. Mp262]|uniref:cell division protein FtsQ/DivIB n=1 Tax=Endozoicomonas sp. Mp262 TaxID=2919499 RepID=UPI0021DB2489